MTSDQELKLAKYLRDLEEKLADESEDWTSWVQGSLIGIAEMLELTNSFKAE